MRRMSRGVYVMGFPPQQQSKPGIESIMIPRPIFDNPNYKSAGKLMNKVALITGGDSGIGRAIAVAFAKEGADIAISYLDEHSMHKKRSSTSINTGVVALSFQAILGMSSLANKL
jgi:hypothetical protein